MVEVVWKGGTRRTLVAAAVVLLLTAIMLALPKDALAALPSERPDITPMVDGRVKAIEQVGSNIWVGGRFSQVENRNGRVLGNVNNLAVFDSKTNRYKDIAPEPRGHGGRGVRHDPLPRRRADRGQVPGALQHHRKTWSGSTALPGR